MPANESPLHWSVGARLRPNRRDPAEWSSVSDGTPRGQPERWYLHGQDLNPTAKSRDIEAQVEYDDEGRGELISLTVRPSAYIRDTDGHLKERERHEERLAPITASTLSRITVSEMRTAIARHWAVMARRAHGTLLDKAKEHDMDSALDDPNAADQAEWATAILEEQRAGVWGYLQRLADQEPRAADNAEVHARAVEKWHKRAGRLRTLRWLGQPEEPGDLLIHWRKRNPDTTPELWEEPNGTS